MACLNPLHGWRSKRLNKNQKREITFHRKDGFEDMPLQVPCNKCEGCLKDNQAISMVQLVWEGYLHDIKCFMTLTYDDDNYLGKMEFIDVQKFIRAIRKIPGMPKFKYHALSERGETSGRWHFHLTLFGVDFMAGSFKTGENSYSHPEIINTWGKGNVHIAPFTPETALYVAGHAKKRQAPGESKTSASKHLGKGALDKFVKDIISAGCVIIGDNRYPVPPSFFLWQEAKLASVKDANRAHVARETPEKRWEKRVTARSKEINLRAARTLRRPKL